MNLREYESFIFTERNAEWVLGLFKLTLDILLCVSFFFIVYFILSFSLFMIKCYFDDLKRRIYEKQIWQAFKQRRMEEREGNTNE